MKKTALITGPTSGIGLGLAKKFAQDEFDLVLVSRGKEQLEKLADDLEKKYRIKAHIIARDLSKENSPEDVFDEVQKKKFIINILVNNAGFGVYGNFSENDLEKEVESIKLNVIALTKLSKLFLKEMIKRKEGKIVNIASTAAFQPGPLAAVYYATKSYVLHFSEALANELKGTGVEVIAICPGPTSTGFQQRANMTNSRITSLNMNVEKVANAAYKAIKKGKNVEIIGLKNKILAQSVRLAPRKLVTSIVRAIQEKRS